MTRTEHLIQIKADRDLGAVDIAHMLNKAIKKYDERVTEGRVLQWLAQGKTDDHPPAYALALLERLYVEGSDEQ